MIKISDSYPFLSIARKYGLDYGIVLTYANYNEDMRTGGNWKYYPIRYEEAFKVLDNVGPIDDLITDVLVALHRHGRIPK